MMEPKLEHFLASLKQKNFSVTGLVSQEDGLAEFLYYVDRVRAKQVAQEILERIPQRDDRELVVQSLAKAYPLSQYIIPELLQSIPSSDTDFIFGFDMANIVINQLKTTLRGIAGNVHKTSHEFNQYNEDIESLEKQLAQYSDQASELEGLRKERNSLEAKVEQMRKDASRDNLEQQIEDLDREYNRLLEKRRKQSEERKKRLGSIDALKRELAQLNKSLDNGEEQLLIRQLLQKFPVDVEDRA